MPSPICVCGVSPAELTQRNQIASLSLRYLHCFDCKIATGKQDWPMRFREFSQAWATARPETTPDGNRSTKSYSAIFGFGKNRLPNLGPMTLAIIEGSADTLRMTEGLRLIEIPQRLPQLAASLISAHMADNSLPPQ
jgi:hypothetical protein